MAVPKKHDTKSKVGKRRSQKTLKKIQAVVCGRCRGPVRPHSRCAACGYYSRSLKTKKRISEAKPKEGPAKETKPEEKNIKEN